MLENEQLINDSNALLNSNNKLPNQEIITNLTVLPSDIITTSLITINSKICTKCKTEQPLSNFGKQSLLKDRLKHWCKSCVSSYHKLRYINKKKKIKKQVKTWQTNNPEKVKKYQATYAQKIWEQVRKEQEVALQNQSQASLPVGQTQNQ